MKKYRIILSLILGLFCAASFAQQVNLDSLEKILPELPDDSSKVETLGTIVYQYLYRDREKAQQYSDQLMQLSQDLGHQDGIANAKYMDVAIQQFSGNSEQALEMGEKALDWAREENVLEVQAQLLNMMCLAAQTLNNLDQALAYILAATEVSEKLGNTHRIAVSYYTTASVYEYLDEKETAKNYLLRALELFEQLEDDYRVAVVNQALSVVTPPEESVVYAQKGLEGMRKTNDFQGQGMALWTLGAGLIELGQGEEGLERLREAYDLFREIDYPEGLANVGALIGTELAKNGAYNEARTRLEEAEDLAREIGTDDVLGEVFKGWLIYYAGIGETDQVAAYLDSTLAVKDTLFSRDKAQLLIEKEAQLRTREKEAQLAQQALTIERTHRQRNVLILSALLIIAVLIALFQYFRNRSKIKQQQTQLSLQEREMEAKKLRELDQLKSSFFANISHEFRTPLTLIKAPISQIEEMVPASEAPEEVEEVPVPMRHVQIIKRNAARLENLINQLMDLSKLESGNMQLRISQEEIIPFLRSLVFSFESLAERKRIQYQTDFPPAPEEAFFDRDKVEKIVVNILSNAFKFTPEAGSIRVQVDADPRELRMSITDSGPGIPAEEVDKIFNRFYQMEGTEDKGTGIGLSLVKELVDLHRGQIAVDSRLGQGTTFIISLPVHKQAYRAEEISSPEPTSDPTFLAGSAVLASEEQNVPAGTTVASSKLPIALIVEDNPDLRYYIGEILEGKYQVQFAGNGQMGWEKAEAVVPDIIVSDVMMPGLSGFELTEKLKTSEKTSHIPIILLTAKAGQDHKIEGLQTGADDYLTKPFDRLELQTRMSNLITQRKRMRAHFQQELQIRPSQISLDSMEERFLKQVMEAVEKNIGNEYYTVEELAKTVGFSRSQLHRKLRALIDKTPNELIRDFRLTRAKEMLEQRSGTVSEIAYKVGYSNLSYFSKSFKAAFGKSPSEM